MLEAYNKFYIVKLAIEYVIYFNVSNQIVKNRIIEIFKRDHKDL